MAAGHSTAAARRSNTLCPGTGPLPCGDADRRVDRQGVTQMDEVVHECFVFRLGWHLWFPGMGHEWLANSRESLLEPFFFQLCLGLEGREVKISVRL
jgi:hypothetical protein